MELDLNNTRLKGLVKSSCLRIPEPVTAKVLTIKDFPYVPNDHPNGAGYTMFPERYLRHPGKSDYKAAILLFEPHFENISNTAGIGIIVHEFGHVHQGPKYFTSCSEEERKRRVLEIEIEADEIARSWGFDLEITVMRKEIGVPLV